MKEPTYFISLALLNFGSPSVRTKSTLSSLKSDMPLILWQMLLISVFLFFHCKYQFAILCLLGLAEILLSDKPSKYIYFPKLGCFFNKKKILFTSDRTPRAQKRKPYTCHKKAELNLFTLTPWLIKASLHSFGKG